MMNTDNCKRNWKRFEFCSAPLCPMDEASQQSSIWYPDEETCQLNEFRGLDWVKRQRRLSRKALPGYYFTLTMLQQDFIIKKGICGLDPDCEISAVERDENKWLKCHPEKRELTDSEKEVLRNRMLKINKGLTPD
jgi:hypothetical protein